MAYRIQSRVGVQAPASAVWAVLSEIEQWGAWNPLFTEVEGRLSIGALMQMRRAKGNGRAEREEVRVVDWVPNAQIVWLRTIAPFARALAYLEIEALTERGCILAGGEIYQGIIGEMIAKRDRRALNAGFQALCEAAKARAEATWDGTPDEPVPPTPPPPNTKLAPGRVQSPGRGGLHR